MYGLTNNVGDGTSWYITDAEGNLIAEVASEDDGLILLSHLNR